MNDDKDQQNIDPFTRMMFGNQRRSASKNSQNKEPQNEADFSTLLQQLDDIMNSYDKIKPAIKELSPLLDLLKLKNKD